MLVCLGLFGLGMAAAWSRSRRAEPPPGGVPQRYLYCPECGLEMTCPPEFEGRKTFCPHCLTRRMEVNAFSRNGDGPRPPVNRALVALAVAVPLALAAAVYAAGRLRARQEQGPGAEARRFACPECGHRMASNVFGPGSTAVCPACAAQFVVPGAKARKESTANGADVQEWGAWLGSELTKKVKGGRADGL